LQLLGQAVTGLLAAHIHGGAAAQLASVEGQLDRFDPQLPPGGLQAQGGIPKLQAVNANLGDGQLAVQLELTQQLRRQFDADIPGRTGLHRLGRLLGGCARLVAGETIPRTESAITFPFKIAAA